MSIQQCAQDVVAIIPHRMVTMPDGTRLPLRVAFVAIAGQESSWNATQRGDKLGTCRTCQPSDPHCGQWTSFGYFQFHLPAWYRRLRRITGSADPCTWAAWLQHGRHNVTLAWQAYQDYERIGQNGFRPWWPDVAGPYRDYPRVTEAHPRYQKYLKQARQAVAAAEQRPGGSSGGSGSVPPPVIGPPSTGGSGWIWAGVGLIVMGGAAIAWDEWRGL